MSGQRPIRWLPWVLTAAGGLGLLAALVLIVEKVRVLEDPAYVPSCSINPILSCGSVMTSDQADAFGFPNPLLGLIGFSVVTATGAALLAGAVMRRWYWLGLQVGATAGAVFVWWLTFQSLYRIDALCPYCLVVWVVVAPIWVAITVHNLSAGHLGARLGRAGEAFVRNHTVVLTVWYLVAIALILERFWDYWRSLVT